MDCGDLIERVIVGQRSTFICPTCQPDPVVN
ncbi:MAG: zinc finger domain-containing protein [Anaerolineales bacterium]